MVTLWCHVGAMNCRVFGRHWHRLRRSKTYQRHRVQQSSVWWCGLLWKTYVCGQLPTAYVLSMLALSSMLTTCCNTVKTFDASVEVASDRADHQVEKPLEIVGAVEVDANDASVVPECLNVHIGLQVLSELLLDSFRRGIGR